MDARLIRDDQKRGSHLYKCVAGLLALTAFAGVTATIGHYRSEGLVADASASLLGKISNKEMDCVQSQQLAGGNRLMKRGVCSMSDLNQFPKDTSGKPCKCVLAWYKLNKKIFRKCIPKFPFPPQKDWKHAFHKCKKYRARHHQEKTTNAHKIGGAEHAKPEEKGKTRQEDAAEGKHCEDDAVCQKSGLQGIPAALRGDHCEMLKGGSYTFAVTHCKKTCQVKGCSGPPAKLPQPAPTTGTRLEHCAKCETSEECKGWGDKVEDRLMPVRDPARFKGAEKLAKDKRGGQFQEYPEDTYFIRTGKTSTVFCCPHVQKCVDADIDNGSC